MATVQSNGTIYTTGLISASDLNDIANYYRSYSNYTVNFTAPNTGALATAADFNNLRQAVINGANPYWKTDNIPGSVSSGWEISSTTWGPPLVAFVSYTSTYYSGVASVIIPPGCGNIVVQWLVAGGGGGGFGAEHGATVTGGGGGGGSGGYYQNQSFSVSSGDTLTITVGAGGTMGNWADGNETFPGNADNPYTGTGDHATAGGPGGDSTFSLNGNTVLSATGGDSGTCIWSGYGGGDSKGGSPNGTDGGAGQTGSSDSFSGNGGDGGDSAYPNSPGGAGGLWGNYTYATCRGQDATGYGSGGGGGGCYDRHDPETWPGGAGAPGISQIQFNP